MKTIIPSPSTPGLCPRAPSGLTLLLLALLLTPGTVHAQGGTLLTTFATPDSGNFGGAVAALGSDQVLIGATGFVYLFSASGTLLRTFIPPEPPQENSALFGRAVAAVGSDRVLIGAPWDNTGQFHAGSAYLFNAGGTLLTTIHNPAPAASAGEDSFGGAVAALGSDLLVIGAPEDDTGAQDAGKAYLFSSSGTLLRTFSNPSPQPGENFGGSVAALGSDRVLIGARFESTGFSLSGAVYLFGTGGALFFTFNSPTPHAEDNFGTSVAAVGSDRVLIGAPGTTAGALHSGTAYLFSADGTLLTTFTNPAPGANDQFGFSVAAVGTDKVLIGAISDSTGAAQAGSAYLFSTGGTLLATSQLGHARSRVDPAAKRRSEPVDRMEHHTGASHQQRPEPDCGTSANHRKLQPFLPPPPTVSTGGPSHHQQKPNQQRREPA